MEKTKPKTGLAAEKILKLKDGERIKIAGVSERQALLHAARTLHGAGVIKFRLRTWADKDTGGFVGMAVKD